MLFTKDVSSWLVSLEPLDDSIVTVSVSYHISIYSKTATMQVRKWWHL